MSKKSDQKIEQALDWLKCAIAEGMEYPDAEFQAQEGFELNAREVSVLRGQYDNWQGDMGD